MLYNDYRDMKDAERAARKKLLVWRCVSAVLFVITILMAAFK